MPIKQCFYSKSGQSIMEYAIVLVVIVGIIIVAVSKIIKPQTNLIYQIAGNRMDVSTSTAGDQIGVNMSFPDNLLSNGT